MHANGQGSDALKNDREDILSHDQFRRAKIASLSPGTRAEWQVVGSLPVDDSGILVIDPMSFKYAERNGGNNSLESPSNTRAQCFLEVLKCPNRKPCVCAIKMLFHDAHYTQQKHLKIITPVDSGLMMIADEKRLQKSWRIGGEHNETGILVRIFDGELGNAGRRALAEFRKMDGVEFEQVDTDSYQFLGSMNDDEIELARQIVDQSNNVSRIVVFDDSLQNMKAQLDCAHVATHFDSAGELCAFLFRSGFGDGCYGWDALSSDERIVGYFCDLIEGI